MKVVAFIPIKLNNQRLPGKNTKDLGGKPMCSYLFDTVKRVGDVDEKYVYCSSEEIRKYIPDGIRFLKRSDALDTPETKGLQIIESFLNDVFADVYIITHVTSPFLKMETMQNAIKQVLSGKYDSAFSAQEIKSYGWYEGKPINYNLNEIVTTQNLRPIYIENGGFYIFRREVFTTLHRRIGENPFIAITDNIESVDVDTLDDFKLAQAVALLQKQNS